MMITSTVDEKVCLLRLALKGLDEVELAEMASLMELHTYPPGHILCHEGANEAVFYIIAEGHVIITKQMEEDVADRILRVGSRGDLVGEMALIQNAPRSATVRATTPCTVLEMNKADFETVLSHSPRMALDIIRITFDRLRANDQMAIIDLQKTNQVLRQLDRNKLEFIQVAAHELRTPLTVLMGYANVLRTFPELTENPALGEIMAGIQKGANRMHEVVNMMLDVTRIDVEDLKIASVPVLLKRVVAGLVLDLEKPAAERGIQIRVEYAEETPIILADPGLIEKALYQLLVNAIKYTPDGGQVLVRVRPISLDDQIPGVEIAVIDAGIGLDAEHHSLVFEKFYQVGQVALHSTGKTSFKGGGPGLGLALVRGVTRAHGGRVWVESVGHDEVNFPGSTFYLQLPVNRARP
jgi:signal transduction histidine kinase